MRSPNPYQPPALEPDQEWPDPPQVQGPDPPGLLKRSVVAGSVAAVVFGFGTFFAATVLLNVVPGGMLDAASPKLLIAAFPGALIALAMLVGFVAFRRQLFARRRRRRRR